MKNYDEFLHLTGNAKKYDKFHRTYQQVLEEGRRMSLDEADKIFDELAVPTEIREWIELEASNVGNYKHSVHKNMPWLTDFLPEIDQSLNEDEEWINMNEEELNEFESAMWESIYDYITVDVINEGFWSSLVSRVKSGVKKAIEVGKKLITGIGKLIKGAIEATKKGISSIKKYAIGLAKGLMDKIKNKAAERFQKLEQHSEEQIDQDVEDLNATTSWIVGKGIDQGTDDGVKGAGEIGATAIQADQEGKNKAIEKIKKAEMADKKAKAGDKPKPKVATPSPKNENARSNVKEAHHALSILSKCSKEELYELSCVSLVMELHKDGKLNEAAIEKGAIEGMNISEGFWQKVKKFFGLSKDKDDSDMEKAKAIKNMPGEKEEEERLLKKDKEAEKNTKAPEISGETPENKLEDKKTAAEKDAESGDMAWTKILLKIVRTVVQGPILILEWIAEKGFRIGIRFASACAKRLGGPGVFLFIAIAAGCAILFALAIELAVVGDHESTLAHVFHFSALGAGISWLEHAAEEMGKSLLKTCMPFISYIPPILTLVFGFLHLKHIFHDRRMGKSVDHSLAIEKEEKYKKKDEEEIESTKDEKLKELLIEKTQLHDKVIEFHVNQRDRKLQLHELEEKLNKKKKELKEVDGGKDYVKYKEKVEEAEKAIKENKEKLKELKNKEDSGERTQKDYDNLMGSSQGGMAAPGMSVKDKIADFERTIKEQEEEKKEYEEKLKEAAKEMSEEGKKLGDEILHDEHHLHEEEHGMKEDFDKFFEGSTYKRMKVIKKKIKEYREGKKESNTLPTYNQFVNENLAIEEEEDYVIELEKSYYYDHPRLRETWVNKKIDEWITKEFGFEIDEEMLKYRKIGAPDSLLVLELEHVNDEEKEETLAESKYYLLPKTLALYNEVGKKYSGFKVGSLARWSMWSFEDNVPLEVEKMAKELGAPFDKIMVYKDDFNPDAFDMFLEELPKLQTLYREGVYKNRRGKEIRFIVAVNC